MIATTPRPVDPVEYNFRIAHRVFVSGMLGLLFLWVLPGVFAKLVGVLMLMIGAFATARAIRDRRRIREAAELMVQDAKRDGMITEEQVAAMQRLTPVHPDRAEI